VCAIIYEYVYTKAKPSLYELRVAKKLVKGALNLQDLRSLIIFIYNISLYDFTMIQTARAKIYLFTMGTPYKMSRRWNAF
jgi:hypothetical protein